MNFTEWTLAIGARKDQHDCNQTAPKGGSLLPKEASLLRAHPSSHPWCALPQSYPSGQQHFALRSYSLAHPKQESERPLGCLHSLLYFQGHFSDRERQTGNYNRRNLTCNCVETSHRHSADSPSSTDFKWGRGKNHHVWVLSADLILVLFLIILPSLGVQETTSQCGEGGNRRRKGAVLCCGSPVGRIGPVCPIVTGRERQASCWGAFILCRVNTMAAQWGFGEEAQKNSSPPPSSSGFD